VLAAGASKEDVVAAVHEHLRGVAAGLGAGAVPLGKFVITKQLTKRLEDYPDAKNQPHVQVSSAPPAVLQYLPFAG
jgi:DNA polymerase alpha subunit A